MIRLIAFAAFALALATSAQAISLAPLHQPDGIITQVREACGSGYAHGQWCLRPYGRPPERRQVCSWNAYSGWPLRSLECP